MAQIISFQSFRRGLGKTNIIASLAAVMAAAGKRVGVIDTDVQTPSTHMLFGVKEEEITYFLNDYLDKRCHIEDVIIDVTDRLNANLSGCVKLAPSNPSPEAIVRMLRLGFDLNRLKRGYLALERAFDLDILLVDTQAGITQQGLVSLAVSDAVVIVFRLDKQDYQGTALLVDLARSLEVPSLSMVVNEIPSSHDLSVVRQETEEAFDLNLLGTLHHSETLMMLASRGVFALEYPGHPITKSFYHIADQLMYPA